MTHLQIVVNSGLKPFLDYPNPASRFENPLPRWIRSSEVSSYCSLSPDFLALEPHENINIFCWELLYLPTCTPVAYSQLEKYLLLTCYTIYRHVESISVPKCSSVVV